jgi:hypothetical protein
MLPIGAFEHYGDRRIKLYGGGGSWNPVTIVEDAVTSVGDAVAPIVEGVSDAGVAIDKGVNDAVPGGWATVGAAALAAATYGASLAAEGAVEGGVLATEGAGGLTGGGAFVPAAESGASFVIPEGASYTTGALGAGAGATELAGPTYAELGVQAGPTYGELGYTGLEAGQMGPTYGELGYQGINMGADIAAADAASAAAAEAAAKEAALKDALSTANNIRKVYGFANSLLSPSQVGTLRSYGLPTGAQSGGQSGSQDSSSQAGGTVTGALPGNLKETSLVAAPVMQGTNMNLTQLKQLYPQLSTVDPRIVQMLTGKNANIPNYYNYGAEQGGSTALSAQGQGGLPSPGSPGYPSVAADRTSGQTSLAGSTPAGPFEALSSAGLRAVNTGALPGMSTYGLKDGGSPEHQEGEHIPEFVTGATGHFVQGKGDGQSDDIPAMLADGEYVFDADTVAALGNGSSKAGALQLDKMRHAIRKHKRSASHDKIPPKAKSPLEYMKGK